MATRDYANRKPRSSKSRTSANKKRSQQKQAAFAGVPKFAMAAAAMLLAGFSYFLFSIHGSKNAEQPQEEINTVITTTEAAATTAPVTPAPEPAPVPKVEELPPKPKDEWTYQHQLETKAVEVDVEVLPTKSARPYQMQCASFKDEAQAEEMKAVIAFQGLNAIIRQTQGSNGTWYKVVLGPYDNKRAAESARHSLQRAGINGCQIWYWEG